MFNEVTTFNAFIAYMNIHEEALCLLIFDF